MSSRKDDKSPTIPYDIMIHLLILKSNNVSLNRRFLTATTFNNLSFELLLFYLMFTLAYLNYNENAKIIKEREQYIQSLDTTIKRNLTPYGRIVINTALQAYRAYYAGRDFQDLFDLISNLRAPVKIHVMFINFLAYLYVYIIENNSIKSSRIANVEIKNLKRIIRKIFNVLVNYTMESKQFPEYIIINKDILQILKIDLSKALNILIRNNINTPFDCIEKSICTKIEKLKNYNKYLDDIKSQLEKADIKLERVGGCSACGHSKKKLIKRY